MSMELERTRKVFFLCILEGFSVISAMRAVAFAGRIIVMASILG